MEKFLNFKIIWKTRLYALILINIFLNVLKQINIKGTDLDFKTLPKDIITLMKMMKSISALKFVQLIDMIGVEILSKSIKYNVIYLMLSLIYQIRINIFIQISNLSKIKTSSLIFLNSEWLEREIWDLFGLFFNDNINLRRILTDYGFSHHPFKKNFPLTGHYELNYSFVNKLIELKNVVLFQELRNLLSNNSLGFTYINTQILSLHENNSVITTLIQNLSNEFFFEKISRYMLINEILLKMKRNLKYFSKIVYYLVIIHNLYIIIWKELVFQNVSLAKKYLIDVKH